MDRCDVVTVVVCLVWSYCCGVSGVELLLWCVWCRQIVGTETFIKLQRVRTRRNGRL